MAFSQDYLSTSESSDEDEFKYFKPVYVRRRAARPDVPLEEKGKNAACSGSAKAGDCQKNPATQDPRPRPGPYKLKAPGTNAFSGKEELIALERERIPQECSRSQQEVKPQTRITEPTYEYGNPINGYKFVGSRSDYEKFTRAAESSSPSGGADDTNYIDSRIFDRASMHSKRSSHPDDIAVYWARELGATRAPLPGAPLVQEVTIQSIDKASLADFLGRSALSLRLPLREVLKQQRVVWHPDKVFRGSARANPNDAEKVTRIFQVINSLWEENQ
ncbi:uncharacterized protein KLTH0F06446g [Lachancea thermotolerans CBS 6340]|uniref:KLTH0F06446p n=1 Tax=Lachancea thermotolerans (strain ATCC 56472 / CBS 6340 / NRRL Y-8284) TaxID=559295 RepID=C5DKP6_LACTC|nr:KLTH0F06446p [Lachancea thermotolerans CBS 6340]CAR24047.1 KLTH0F06446p [Lachancea thermotolerans CBS 6340]